MKGSFTGANANRKGLFEAAHNGTIFLDEIGEMSPAMQVKLLRVLQERRVRPVGAHDEHAIDARVIAATNRDLKQMSDEGTFREDLFYRISVIPIHLPPLRERAEDIGDLIDHFVKKFCDQAGKNLTISPKAVQILENYAWHGNVRELEHTIERAVALERSDEIQPEQLPDHITNYNPQRISAEFDLPDQALILSAISTTSKKPTSSKPSAKPPETKQKPPNCSKCKFVPYATSSTNTAFAACRHRCEVLISLGYQFGNAANIFIFHIVQVLE